jgi:hypothetical protein
MVMNGKNRIMIYGPKDDGTYDVVDGTVCPTAQESPMPQQSLSDFVSAMEAAGMLVRAEEKRVDELSHALSHSAPCPTRYCCLPTRVTGSRILSWGAHLLWNQEETGAFEHGRDGHHA